MEFDKVDTMSKNAELQSDLKTLQHENKLLQTDLDTLKQHTHEQTD